MSSAMTKSMYKQGGVSIDGTPISEFTKMGQKINADLELKVSKSLYEGNVLHGIEIIKGDDTYNLLGKYCNCHSTKPETFYISFNYDTSPDILTDKLTEEIKKHGIEVCETHDAAGLPSISYHFKDVDTQFEIGGHHALDRHMIAFMVATGYPAPAARLNSEIDKCLKELPRVSSLVDILKSMENLSDTGRYMIKAEKGLMEHNAKHALQFIYNERNWSTDFCACKNDMVVEFNTPCEFDGTVLRSLDLTENTPIFLREDDFEIYAPLKAMTEALRKIEDSGLNIDAIAYDNTGSTLKDFCNKAITDIKNIENRITEDLEL